MNENLQDDIQAFLLTLDAFAGSVAPLLVASTAAGVIAMAVIQLAKEVAQLRMVYSWVRLKLWMRRRSQQVGVSANQSYSGLLDIAAGGDKVAFYGQPIGDLATRLRIAARLVLEFPEENSAAFCVLMGNYRAHTEVEDWLGNLESGSTDTRRHRFLARKVEMVASRNIDALELSMTHWWKTQLRLLSMAISGLVFLLVLDASTNMDSMKIVIVAVIGGIVAPVAKDLLSMVETLRVRRG